MFPEQIKSADVVCIQIDWGRKREKAITHKKTVVSENQIELITPKSVKLLKRIMINYHSKEFIFATNTYRLASIIII